MYNKEPPTRSDATKRRYEARYLSKKRQFCREAGVDDLDPNEMVAKLIMSKPTLAARTWRQYKAAFLYYIEEHAPQYGLAEERLRQESSSGLKTSSTRTSGPKLKQVPVKSWKSIQSTLQQRIEKGHRHAEGLLHLLTATLLTGLRPNEWAFSELGTHKKTGRPVLRIRNSKHTNGRANGPYRELFIDELSVDEIAILEAALAYCAADNEDDARRIQFALRDEFQETMKLGRASAPPWKTDHFNVTLYSFRHQFIADAKSTFEDPVLISAIVGHKSTATAFEHYGKRRNGRSMIRVYPTPESVESVQKVRLETYREYVANKIKSGLVPN